ncbi:MAG: VWA domain-containing protein, partial [Clostridiales bacterium]|nr:VWA domain-containing protein [Clostridiales bacterium]
MYIISLLLALLALFVALPQGAFAVGPVIGVDHPTEPGEVMLFKEAAPVPGLVNTWRVTLRVEAMDVKQTADIVLVIDRSGSMSGTKLASAKAAAAEFARTLLTPENAALPANDPGKVRVAVVSFAGDVSTDQQLTDNQAAVLSAINGINADGGT